MSGSEDAARTLTQAQAHHRAGRLDEAERLYARVLEADPGHVDALYGHGVLAFQQGRFAEAAERFRKAADLRPGFVRAHNHAGLALKRLGRMEEALAAFREAIDADPDDAQARANVGSALQDLGRSDEAEAAYREALRIRPDLVEAHNNLGTLLREQGRLEESLAAYLAAARLAPGVAMVHSNLGNVLRDLRRHEEAVAAFREALRLAPGDARTHNNLGATLREAGHLDEAEAALRKAIGLDPGLAAAHRNLAGVLGAVGRTADAVAAWEKAVALEPDNAHSLATLMAERYTICAWDGMDDLWRRLYALLDAGAAMPPVSFLAPETTPAQQLACARVFAAERFGHIRPLPPPEPSEDAGADGRITIGYLSADFGEHPVGRLVAGVIEHHDRSRFRVLGYALGDPYPGPMRTRLERAFDRFEDLGSLDGHRAAERIRADGVDILVDLTGYTAHGRTDIPARRPAPVQVSYLGYLGTMGADFIDYVVVDPFVVPPDRQPFFTERLVHLPECYQVAADVAPAPDGPDRAACRLPEGAVVLCCFNNSFKVRPVVFDVWMRVLARVPDGVLWLAARHPLTIENLQREARARGVDPGRLVFADPMPYERYLTLYRHADLFLDTVPYNAGATAVDALGQGCPVVTCAGETFISRMAGSQLTAAGLPELVAGSIPEYEALALRLASAPDARAAVRAKLATARTTAPLFDRPRFTRHLEAAYEAMWRRHRSGEPPAPIAVAP
jgi:protein O-GlcNAc transferase